MKKIFFIFIVISISSVASAAEMYFVYQGGQVSVRLDTEGESINAVSGRVVIPEGATPEKMRSGSGSIVLWVDPPEFSEGSILFSGITPGGVQGDVQLFSFVSSSTKASAVFSIKDAEAYKNDPESSRISVRAVPFVLKSPQTTSTTTIEDAVPPLEFMPEIARDAALYDGERFFAFFAVDKESGIARYEWASSWLGEPTGEWLPAETPLFIPKSAYFKEVYIKAIDNAGNERVIHTSGPYRNLVLGAIIVLLALCALLLYVQRRLRSPSL